ncbi:MAG: fatty acid--CoA ligase [Sphingomonadales bacterium]|nr:MAG: fatty acid--CoA ligase [Sphingomonadales bacterium]
MSAWPTTIVAAAEEAAERWPTAPALIASGRTWTFAELWDEARAAASALLVRGIVPGDRIAIWAPNIPGWIFAALGAQICGAALVPLNTRFKGEEAGDVLRRSRAAMLFTVRGFLGIDYPGLLAGQALPDLRETVLLDDWDAFLAAGRGPNDPAVATAASAVRAEHVSDIIFTSGTTGRPKGALSAHGQVTAMFGDWAVRVDLRAGDRYLIVNPFFHTFGYKAGWVACLVRGATIVPQPEFDVAETARLIETHRVSFIPGPPTIYQSLLSVRGDAGRDLSSLRVAVTGAAPVPPVLVQRMRDELGMANVVNGYGMTECGAITMTCQGDSPELIANSCGTPLPGIELRCVNDDGADVPTGWPGEIWVRGPGVMLGYLDDPVATAEAIDVDGWLHTGDIGTLDADGYLKITDRKKDMFICGGFNCYPAEIEGLLCRHPAIEMAAVIGVPDERMGEVGRAFVVLRSGGTATADGLREWARGAMANYKVPRAIEILDALPRNAAGKVVRAALR